jgi:NIPSNAP
VSAAADHVIDLRTYVLHTGMGDAFHTTVHEGAVPMLRREGIEVVAYGPSLEGEDRYFLIRRFPSLEDRKRRLDAFYNSEEWLETYDERVMSMIDTYHVVVLAAAALSAPRL